MSGEPAITAHELTKQYGDVAALHGVTFEVGAGAIFGYLGRNGSGKTTTVRILTTLTRPTSGTATVAGVRIDRAREVRRRIGVTLQDAALDPSMTGADHLRLVAGLWGLRRTEAAGRTDELLELFGLVDAADRRIATYSGGMQRRLDIATALVRRPSVLFLDEPTTGLDVQSRRALWAEIRRLRADGVTIFLTTQYLEEADELADRIAIVDAGRIVAEGTPAELKALHGGAPIEQPVVPVPSLEEVFLSLTGSSIVMSSDELRQVEPA
jgi:ABC-2 type transport system ATP-binding protein